MRERILRVSGFFLLSTLASLVLADKALASRIQIKCDEGLGRKQQYKVSANFESEVALENMWRSEEGKTYLVPYRLGLSDNAFTTSARVGLDFPNRSPLGKGHFDLSEFFAVNVFSARGQEEMHQMFHGRSNKGPLDVILNFSSQGVFTFSSGFQGHLAIRSQAEQAYTNIKVVCSARALN